MKNRKLFGAITGIIIYAICIMFFSYAFLNWRSSNTLVNLNIQDATFEFDKGPDVNVTNIGPVLNYNDGVSTTFSIMNSVNVERKLNLSLDITELSDNLKNETFKYILLRDNNQDLNYTTVIKEGNFEEFKVGNNTILESYTIDSQSNYNYKFIVYIDGNEKNDHTLMNNVLKSSLVISEQTYSLSLDASGGTVDVTNVDIVKGSPYGELPIPDRTGYTFTGWYTAEEDGEQITPETIVTLTEAHTAYARWSANTYNLTFNPNEGEVSTTTKSVTYDEEYGTLPVPTRTGYNFLGWYTDLEGGTKITDTSTVTITEDATLYAHWELGIITITFDPNGGSVDTTTLDVIYGSAYGTLPSPTRTGYTFNGWYTASSGGDKIESTTTVTIKMAQTLYAQWTANTYTITFNPNEGEVSTTSINVTYGSTYGTLPTPTRTGYTFNGWYTEVRGGNQITENSNVSTTENQTLYAQWTGNTYTVNFDANGGSVDTSTITVIYGFTYGSLPTPTKSGYSFLGWYTAEDGSGDLIKANTIVSITANQILYAHWSIDLVKGVMAVNAESDANIDFSVTSDTSGTNGIYLRNGTQNNTYPIYYYRGNVTNNNLIFANFCWKVVRTTVTGGLKLIYNGIPSNGQCNGTDNSIGYSVFNFNVDGNLANGYMYGTKYKIYGKSIAGSSIIYGKSVSYENGVYTLVDTKSASYAGNSDYHYTCFSTTSTTCNEVYYLVSVLNDNHASYSGIKLNGEANIDEALSNMLDYNTNSSIIKGNKDTEGSIDYWYYHNIYNTNYHNMIEDTVWCVDRSIKNLNNWGKNNNFYSIYGMFMSEAAQFSSFSKLVEIYNNTDYNSLSFNCSRDVDEFTVSETVGNGDLDYPVGLLTAEEIVFAGHTGLDSGSTYLDGGFWLMTPAFMHLETSNMILDDDGRINHENIEIYEEIIGENKFKVRPSISLKNGFVLTGNGNGTATNPYVVDNLIFNNKSTVVVTFEDSSGYIASNSVELNVGDSFGELPILTRTGYTFDGWYTKRTNGVKILSSSIVSEDQTLYAIWVPNSYTVTLNANGGNVETSTITVTYDSTYSNLPIPTRTGYTFAGWYTEASSGSKITTSTKVTVAGSQTLYARWTGNQYTVNFNANGGSVSPTTATVTYNSTYGTLPTPTRAGYTFNGWFTESSGGTKITSSSTVSITQSQTLYAQWTGNSYTVTFNANGGTVGTGSKTVTNGSTYGTLPAPTRSGYVFAGWYTQVSGGSKITASSTVSISAAQTLYARWQEFLVYIDGLYGSDSNDGYTPKTPVETLKQAYTVAKNISNNISTTTGTIYVVAPIQINNTITIDDSYYIDSSGTISLASGKSVVIRRYSKPTTVNDGYDVESNYHNMVGVQTTGKLTLETIILDGHINAYTGSTNQTAPALKAAGVIIHSSGTLTIKNATLQNNNRSAIDNNGGTLIMSGGIIKNNIFGGVDNDESGTFTMSGGTITGNTDSNFAGGGVSNGGIFNLNGGTITGNTARYYGGGIYNSGTFTLTSGTISANNANDGGGLYNEGTAILSGGTITGNKATNYGGGIYSSGGTLNRNGVSVTGNTASSYANIYSE